MLFGNLFEITREGVLSGKFIFASYVVRIYRYTRDDPRGLVGVLEEAGGKGRKVFTCLEELWKILNSASSSDPPLPPASSRSKSRGRRKRPGRRGVCGKIEEERKGVIRRG